MSWTALGVYLLLVLGMVADRSQVAQCQDICIEISDSAVNSFITRQEIYDLLHRGGKKILGTRLGDVNTLKMERELGNTSFIREAEVFKTANSGLNVRLIQREPVLRIMDKEGADYYIDSEGYMMPTGDHYTARVMVGNGAGMPSFSRGKDIKQEPLYKLLMFIHENEFWTAQVEQLHLGADGELVLVPRVGSHIIEFGEINDIEIKFGKLYALYEQGLKREGWNKYGRINLKYESQVVCTRR